MAQLKEDAKPTTDKADLVVYRDETGSARVHPGIFLMHRVKGSPTPPKKNVIIRNCTSEPVTVTFDDGNNVIGATLEWNSDKKRMDVDLSALAAGCYRYEVKVGSDTAAGNSSPTLIIDE